MSHIPFLSKNTVMTKGVKMYTIPLLAFHILAKAPGEKNKRKENDINTITLYLV